MLILAATPIGNLEDASPRLKRTLLEADDIFAEDTRHSAKLLRYLGVTKTARAFHDHSEKTVLESIATLLEAGRRVVYMSDAGMPGISDPGFELVRLARELDVAVDVLPGPSAVINALVLSGLPAHDFCFLGYVPTKHEKREQWIERLSVLQMTAICFEAPTRILATLAFLAERLPTTEVALCREMTKVHQQVLRGTPAQVAECLETIKGEMVLVMGPVVAVTERPSIPRRYQALLAEGSSPSQSIKRLAREYRLSKRRIYNLIHDNRNR